MGLLLTYMVFNFSTFIRCETLPYTYNPTTDLSVDPSLSRLYFARISTKVGFCRVRIIFLLTNYGFSILTILLRNFIFLITDEKLSYLLSVLQWQVRIPFSSFCPVKPDDLVLDPFLIHTNLAIRFEPRRHVYLLLWILFLKLSLYFRTWYLS